MDHLSRLAGMRERGALTEAEYQAAKAKVLAEGDPAPVIASAAAKSTKGCLWLAILAPVLLIGGCFALSQGGDHEDSTSGYQSAVRKACADQVRNGIGQATFRNQSETSSPGANGATNYTATGQADISGRSIQYRCEAQVAADADKTLTVRVASAS